MPDELDLILDEVQPQDELNSILDSEPDELAGILDSAQGPSPVRQPGALQFHLDRIYAEQAKRTQVDPVALQRDLIRVETEKGAGDPATYHRLFNTLAERSPTFKKYFADLMRQPELLDAHRAEAAVRFNRFKQETGTADLTGTFEVAPGLSYSVDSAQNALKSAFELDTIIRHAPIAGDDRRRVQAATMRDLVQQAINRANEQLPGVALQARAPDATAATKEALANYPRLFEQGAQLLARTDEELAEKMDEAIELAGRPNWVTGKTLLSGLRFLDREPTGGPDTLKQFLGEDWFRQAATAFDNAKYRFHLSQLGLTNQNGRLAPSLPTAVVGVNELMDPVGTFLVLGHAKALQPRPEPSTAAPGLIEATGTAPAPRLNAGTALTAEAPLQRFIEQSLYEYRSKQGAMGVADYTKQTLPTIIAGAMVQIAKGAEPEAGVGLPLTPIEEATRPAARENVAQSIMGTLQALMEAPVSFLNGAQRILTEKFPSVREWSKQLTYLSTGNIDLADAAKLPMDALQLSFNQMVDGGREVADQAKKLGAGPEEIRALVQQHASLELDRSKREWLDYDAHQKRMERMGAMAKGERPFEFGTFFTDSLVSGAFSFADTFIGTAYRAFEDPTAALGETIGGAVAFGGAAKVWQAAKNGFGTMLGTIRLNEGLTQMAFHNPEMAASIKARAQQVMERARTVGVRGLTAEGLTALDDLVAQADMVLDHLKQSKPLDYTSARHFANTASRLFDPTLAAFPEEYLSRVSKAGIMDNLRLLGDHALKIIGKPTKFGRLLLDETGFNEVSRVLRDAINGGPISEKLTENYKNFLTQEGREPTAQELTDLMPESLQTIQGMVNNAARLGPTYKTWYESLFGRRHAQLVENANQVLNEIVAQAKQEVVTRTDWGTTAQRLGLLTDLLEKKARHRIETNQYALAGAGAHLEQNPAFAEEWGIGMGEWQKEIQADEALLQRVNSLRNEIRTHDYRRPFDPTHAPEIMRSLTPDTAEFLLENFRDHFEGLRPDEILERPTPPAGKSVAERQQAAKADLDRLEKQIHQTRQRIELGVEVNRARAKARQDLQDMRRLEKIKPRDLTRLNQPYTPAELERFLKFFPEATQKIYRETLSRLPREFTEIGTVADALHRVHAAWDYAAGAEIPTELAEFEPSLHRLRTEMGREIESTGSHRRLVATVLTEGPDNALVHGTRTRAETLVRTLKDATQFYPHRDLGRLDYLREQHGRVRQEYNRLARGVDYRPIRFKNAETARLFTSAFEHGGSTATANAMRAAMERLTTSVERRAVAGVRGNPFVASFAPPGFRAHEVQFLQRQESYLADASRALRDQISEADLRGDRNEANSLARRFNAELLTEAEKSFLVRPQWLEEFLKRNYDPREFGAYGRTALIRDRSVREKLSQGSVVSSISLLNKLDMTEFMMRREPGIYRVQVDRGPGGIINQTFDNELGYRQWLEEKYGPNILRDRTFDAEGILQTTTPYGDQVMVAKPLDPEVLKDLDAKGPEWQTAKLLRRAEQLTADLFLKRMFDSVEVYRNWVLPMDEYRQNIGKYGGTFGTQYLEIPNQPDAYGSWAGKAVHKKLAREFIQFSRSFGSLRAFTDGLEAIYTKASPLTRLTSGTILEKAFGIANKLGRLAFIAYSPKLYLASQFANLLSFYVVKGKLPRVRDILDLRDALLDKEISPVDKEALEMGILDSQFFAKWASPYKQLMRKMYGMEPETLAEMQNLRTQRRAVYEKYLATEPTSRTTLALQNEDIALEAAAQKMERGWMQRFGENLWKTVTGDPDLWGQQTSIGGVGSYLYSLTDTPWRRMLFRQLRASGMDKFEAAETIKRHFQNYRELPNWVQSVPEFAKGMAMAFPLELARNMANHLNYRPTQFLSLFALLGANNFFQMARAGVDWERLGAQLSSRKIDGAPEQIMKFLTSFMVFDRKTKDLRDVYDLGNWIPAFSWSSDIGPVMQAYNYFSPPEQRSTLEHIGALGVQFANSVFFRNPGVSMLTTLFSQTDPVTGQPLTDKSAGFLQKAGETIKKMSGAIIHPLTPIIGYDWMATQAALDAPFDTRTLRNGEMRFYHSKSAAWNLIRAITGLKVSGRPEEWLGGALDSALDAIGVGKKGFSRVGRTAIGDSEILTDIVHQVRQSLEDNPSAAAVVSERSLHTELWLKTQDSTLDPGVRAEAKREFDALVLRATESKEPGEPTPRELLNIDKRLRNADTLSLFAGMPIDAQVKSLVLADRAGVAKDRVAELTATMILTPTGKYQKEMDATKVRRAIGLLNDYLSFAENQRLDFLRADLGRVLKLAEFQEKKERALKPLKERLEGLGQKAAMPRFEEKIR